MAEPDDGTIRGPIAFGLVVAGIVGLAVGPVLFPTSIGRELWLYAIGLQIVSVTLLFGGLGTSVRHTTIGLAIGFVLASLYWVSRLYGGMG